MGTRFVTDEFHWSKQGERSFTKTLTFKTSVSLKSFRILFAWEYEIFFKPIPSHLGRFPKVRTGRPDHGCTAHFENEIGFFREFLMKTDFVRAYYLAFDWSGWIAFIKSKILITKGISWPVSSDKWKAPLASLWHWALEQRSNCQFSLYLYCYLFTFLFFTCISTCRLTQRL